MFDPTVSLIVAGGTVVFSFWWFKASHDRLARLDERCATAWADIDAQLKHRHTLVPGLVEVTRSMADREQKIIGDVCRSYSAIADDLGNPQRRLLSEKVFGASVKKLIEVSVKYPEIQSNVRFHELARELSHVEESLTAARRFYNLTVGEYNAARRSLAGKLVGGIVRQAPRQPFDLGIDRVALEEPLAIRI
jgi:LemA protein